MRCLLRLYRTQRLSLTTPQAACLSDHLLFRHRPFSSDDNQAVKQEASVAVPSQQHWLDRRFPGVREWLEAKNRRWWLKGITAWCRKYPFLQGQEAHLQALIEQSYQRFYARHKNRISDERSQTHLQVACLVLATYKTLMPWIKNHQELIDIIRAHMGEQISPALRFLLQSTLYLSLNPFVTMSNRLKGLQQDYGKGFDTNYTESKLIRHTSLGVTSCFYHEIFTCEGVPQLTKCCCCSQDRIWFHNAHKRGIRFGRSSCIADGDAHCRLVVEVSTPLIKR